MNLRDVLEMPDETMVSVGFVRELFESQPVTMIAAATIVGSVIVWAVLEALSLW